MKKLLLLFILTSSALTASADDYNALYFYNTDGTETLGNITAKGVTITFSDGNLTAVNTTTSESVTLALSDLGKMAIATESTGINIVTTDRSVSLGDADAIYDLSGRRLSKGKAIKSGIYILKKDGQAIKVKK